MVIAIIAILAAMLMPAINAVRQQAFRTNSGNNQRQIVLASLVYANDNEQQWPARPSSAGGVYAATGLSTSGTTYSSFEFLAASGNGDLTGKVFRNPALASTGPTTKADPLLTYTAGTSGWAAFSSAATTPLGRIAYAYDWTVPSNASSNRVVISDRGDLAHTNKVMICFADAHIATSNKVAVVTAGGTMPTRLDNSAFVNQYLNNDAKSDNVAATGDDIFTGVADGITGVDEVAPTAETNIGAGQKSRCWLF